MNEEHKDKLIGFYHTKRRMPSYAEMMALFGYKSKNSVHKLVNKLIDAGLIVKDRLGKLAPTELFSEVKKLGLVKAGFPSPAEEELQDTMSLDDYLIQKKESTYILEVDGDSMIDAHIADGDLVIVERTNKAKDGEIVIAEVDGEWTMKYFRQKGGKVWLEPANKKYRPIHPTENLVVAAVVKGVIRKY